VVVIVCDVCSSSSSGMNPFRHSVALGRVGYAHHKICNWAGHRRRRTRRGLRGIRTHVPSVPVDKGNTRGDFIPEVELTSRIISNNMLNYNCGLLTMLTFGPQANYTD
jgi:hypothetical protein